MGALNNKGFSMLEMLAAGTLLAALLVGIMRTFVSAHQIVPAELARSAAVNLARDKAETLFESVRQDWWANAGHPLTVGTNVDAVVVPGFTGSQRTTTVTSVDVDGDGSEDYRKAEVTVTWA